MKVYTITTSEDSITPKALDRLSLVPANSVLAVVRSGILSRTLPVSINTIPVTINQDMRAISPRVGISAAFLAYQLIANEREILASCSKHGTTVASIEGPALARFPIWIAPTAEQTRIVAKLEELLSDLDAGVAELKAAQRKLQQYRQSLLKAAVEGTLTAAWRKQNPPQESGAELLARILVERRARWEAKQLARFAEQGKAPPKGWCEKYKTPLGPQGADLTKLPVGWSWAALSQLLEGLTSGSRDWAPYYDRGTCTFVMAQNVRPWRPDFSFRQMVDPPANDRDRARSQVRLNDLLVTIVGANTGQACRLDQSLESHFVCQSVALLRLLDPSMSDYINAVLNSEGHGQRQFREMNYGAGRPHLSFDQIESVCIPLPPLQEQHVITRQIEIAFDSLQLVQVELDRLQEQSTVQRQNILRAAFAGQLVPQDPDDEPASVLLARIRAEHAQGPAKARKPRRHSAQELA